MTQEYYRGKSILITGASSGLGYELATQLSAKGASVLAIARSSEKLRSLQSHCELQGNKIETSVCDVTDSDALQSLLSDRSIDIAILNAGVKESGGELFSKDRILKTFNTNFVGTLNCVHSLLEKMLKRRGGNLVFISSMGAYHGGVGTYGYNASKIALSNLADSLRMDLKASGVRITDVKPGIINTKMIPASGIAKFFAINVNAAAEKILEGISKNRIHIVFPRGFQLLTLTMAMLPKRLQGRLLGGVRS
jgi:short-subunit dehydrogenase